MLHLSFTRRARVLLMVAAASAAALASPITASADDFDIDAAPVIDTDDPETDDPETDDPETDDPELLAACPIDGDATFEDSWGWARSGGRSHEGVDMIADHGTPIVAVRDGDVVFKNNRLGGNAVWLTAPNGDKFYYAHLDSFAGNSRTVEAGELIGFVGSTGNAQGPHLHFETLPGGSVENPHPHTVAACVPTPEELAVIAAHEANALNDPSVWERFFPVT